MGTNNIEKLLQLTAGRKGISSCEQHFLMLIAHHANDKTHTCFFANETAVDETKMTDKTFRKARRSLVRRGFIAYREGRRGHASDYFPLFLEGPVGLKEDPIPEKVVLDKGVGPGKKKGKDCKITEERTVNLPSKDGRNTVPTETTEQQQTATESAAAVAFTRLVVESALEKCGIVGDAFAANALREDIRGRRSDLVCKVIEAFDPTTAKNPIGLLRRKLQAVMRSDEKEQPGPIQTELYRRIMQKVSRPKIKEEV